MKPKKSSALDAIKAAMETEMDAHNFYSRAAQKTENSKGKDMFFQLADFEMNHFRHLKALYYSLKAEGKWITYHGTTFSIEGKKIKALSVKKEVESQANDLDALSIAIKEERKTRKYYLEMVQKTANSLGKDIFKKLAREEELHERVLNDQFYSLTNNGLWTWGD
ncbi:MAG: ferritin family protein [Syntrophobacterales bacterium]|nr:MAG: ferritin family protein [Syntrophobacterales bacterium]